MNRDKGAVQILCIAQYQIKCSIYRIEITHECQIANVIHSDIYIPWLNQFILFNIKA